MLGIAQSASRGSPPEVVGRIPCLVETAGVRRDREGHGRAEVVLDEIGSSTCSPLTIGTRNLAVIADSDIGTGMPRSLLRCENVLASSILPTA